MRKFSVIAKNVPASPAGGYYLRWRGRQEGPHAPETIDALLENNQIGLLHEINHQGEWLTIRDFMARGEAALRQQLEADEAHRRELEESERAEKEHETLQAEQQRKAAEAQIEARRLQSPMPAPPILQPVPGSRNSSSLRRMGLLLLLGGLVVTTYFFFGYDTSVDSELGRVNNIGLMADRQNGILIGLGLAIVGTIMLVIGSRD